MGCGTQELYYGRDVAIAGFGDNTESGGYGTKRWGETIISSAVTQDNPGINVGEAGLAGCSGDSGGPAFIQYEDGTWHTFGITSGGPPCGQGADTYAMPHRWIEWLETESGLDLTPCYDQDGTWNPTADCGDVSMDPLNASTTWASR